MPKKKLADLVSMFSESESLDKGLFAEQRTNVQLVAGEHYTRRGSKFWNRIREEKSLSKDQKLRLTKNHIQKIVKTYVNQILNHAPGVAIGPNNEDEIQDRKSAELNNAVWQFAKRRYRLKERIYDFANDYVTFGEAFGKIVWDERKGEHIGYEQKVSPQTGEPLFEEATDPMTGMPMQGEPIADEEKPIFSGDFVIKRIFPFNLRRPPGVQNLDDAEWLGEVELEPIKKVKSWVRDKPELVNKITEDASDNFFIFDGNTQGYSNKKDHVQVNSVFYRPSYDYPNGYFYIFTNSVVLFEGELPFGIFPIFYSGFDPVATSPRCRSIIKQVRPYQIEINRCASKIAEHQVTLGDDKLLVQNGTQLTQGINLPGVRALNYSGREPIIVQGRAGAQFMDYMVGQIDEMYNVANIPEELATKVEQGQDPWGQLFKSIRQKKKFSLYGEKFERFQQDFCDLFLKLAKEYYDENFLIPIVGKNELVNLSEFKNTDPLHYQIKLEAKGDDVESQYGKQLAINQSLQYVGKQLNKADIGRLMRAMPFGNFEESFEELTLDYDLANNMILALDRGQQPQPSPYDDTTYVIKRLVNRIRQPDFAQLDPQVQQLYMQYKDYYEQMEANRQRQILAAQADFIPTGGAKVKVDFYVPKKGSPDKSERATLPAEAINWLVERLADQGTSQDRLVDMGNEGAVAEIAALTTGGVQRQGA